jgi:hypothetical protein
MLDRSRKYGQIIPIVPRGQREGLNETGRDPVTLDRGRHRPLDVQQGVEIGIGEQLAERLQTALAAPHPGEPIMDDRNS